MLQHQSRLKKHKVQKLRLLVLIVFSFSIFFLTLLFLNSWMLNNNIKTIQSNLVEFGFQPSLDSSLLSKAEIEHGKNFAIGMHYPVFEQQEIQQGVQQVLTSIREDFLHRIQDYKPNHPTQPALLNIDYEMHEFNKKYISIVYQIKQNTYGYLKDTSQYQTQVYDLENCELLPIQEVFNDSFLNFIATYITKELKGRNFPFNRNLEEKLSPSWENYQSILFSSSHITVYFNEIINPENSAILNIEIPLEILSSYILQNITGYEFQSNNSMLSPIDMDKEPHEQTPKLSEKIDPTKPMVALTYDDGPHSVVTNGILDQLESVNGRATFFVLGELVKKNPETLKRAVNLGCQIGNHSYHHLDFTKISGSKMKKEILSTNNIIEQSIGKIPTLFRPPYGATNQTVRQQVDLPFILWSIDTLDWKSRNAQSVINKVISNVQDGDIILMHDIYSSTQKASETIIPTLVERGFQLVTVDELIYHRSGKMPSNKIYYNGK